MTCSHWNWRWQWWCFHWRANSSSRRPELILIKYRMNFAVPFFRVHSDHERDLQTSIPWPSVDFFETSWWAMRETIVAGGILLWFWVKVTKKRRKSEWRISCQWNCSDEQVHDIWHPERVTMYVEFDVFGRSSHFDHLVRLIGFRAGWDHGRVDILRRCHQV